METTIFGPPGTGKTTKLLNIVDEALQDGTHPTRIGFFSFTRKAAEEARSRAVSKFNLDVKDFLNFRTLHSLAYHTLGLQGTDVMRTGDWSELSEVVGLPFTANGSLNMDEGLLFKPGRGGDAYISVINLARVKQIGLIEQFNETDDWRLSRSQLEVVDSALSSYKSVKGKLDFVDMIEQFIGSGEGPYLDLLIIDEAQDLAPLQWKMVKEVLVPRAERVYYAGDDDQCIYNFAGVNVQDFMNSCENIEVLNKSYRLPPQIFNQAARLIKRVGIRQRKYWSPGSHEGSVNWHYDPYTIDMKKGEWLVLGRTNAVVNEFGSALKDQGILFWREGRGKKGWSVSENILESLETWIRLCRGEDVSFDTLRVFTKFVRLEVASRSCKRKINALDCEMTYNLDYVIKNCGFEADSQMHWSNVIKVSDKEVTYITSVRRMGEKILGNTKPRIRLSTIHGAKGGEADNVVLLTETNKACENSKDQDSEIRCFYVGMTRAKKNLHIVESGDTRFRI